MKRRVMNWGNAHWKQVVSPYSWPLCSPNPVGPRERRRELTVPTTPKEKVQHVLLGPSWHSRQWVCIIQVRVKLDGYLLAEARNGNANGARPWPDWFRLNAEANWCPLFLIRPVAITFSLRSWMQIIIWTQRNLSIVGGSLATAKVSVFLFSADKWGKVLSSVRNVWLT